ncbi:MAG: WD40/YVTN/BNR-like repeat-containing protein, partial [Chloroflexota bacterium]
SGGLYRTLDGGGVWERVLPSPERVYAVAVDAGEGMVYAGTETGLYWSAAGGEAGSWQMMVAGPGERAVRCVAMGPEAAEYVHVGGADGVYRGRR